MPFVLSNFNIEAIPNKQGLVLKIEGDWSSTLTIPSLSKIEEAMQRFEGNKTLILEGQNLTHWGSSLAAFLFDIYCLSNNLQFKIEDKNLPIALQGLLQLAQGTPSHDASFQTKKSSCWLEKIGQKSIVLASNVRAMLNFLGEIALALPQLFRGKFPFRARDFYIILQQCGAEALPIVTLISFLVGLTMAFVGSIQLSAFGASIYVANLVSLAMTREMGAMMAGIILCGRTGAAFASQIGSMKVSEEIDALRTLGISPIEYIVLPRIIALFLMMPLLCLYADFIGILGGLSASMWMLDISLAQYVLQTKKAVSLLGFSTGVIKSTVFGALVAITGCFRGMRCGSNASAIGAAATSAVVMGITSIVVADALFAIIFHVLDI